MHSRRNFFFLRLRSKLRHGRQFLKIAAPCKAPQNVWMIISSRMAKQTTEYNVRSRKKNSGYIYLKGFILNLVNCHWLWFDSSYDWTFVRCIRKLRFFVVFSQVVFFFSLFNSYTYEFLFRLKVEIKMLWTRFPSLKIHDGDYQSVSNVSLDDHLKMENFQIEMKSSLFRNIRLSWCIDNLSHNISEALAGPWLWQALETFRHTVRTVSGTDTHTHTYRQFDVLGAQVFLELSQSWKCRQSPLLSFCQPHDDRILLFTS